MQYIYLFDTDENYQSSKNTLELPNVSYVEKGNVYYNPYILAPVFNNCAGLGTTIEATKTMTLTPVGDCLKTVYNTGTYYAVVYGENLSLIENDNVAVK